MSEVAPGKTLRDKTLLGLYAADGTLAGVLDVIHDYPVPGEWFLGLLLLDPQWRGQGLGTAVVRAAEAWAAQGGARAIGLGVVEVNVDALRFWQRLGYAEVSRTARRPFGQREHVVIVLRRTLDT